MTELNFDKDPGAVKYGNFINYYTFASVEERISLLPTSLWNKEDACYALDVGCNTGDLTVALQQFIENYVAEDCFILGVDIDASLIETANEKFSSEKINFLGLDFTKDRSEISNFLREKSLEKFNIVFCFSVTMWIHINHGDEGLKAFLHHVTKLGNIIVIEPQPWKCYRKAVRRMMRSGDKAPFPLFGAIKIRKNVEEAIENFLVKECNCQKLWVTDKTNWERKIMIFKTSTFS